MSMAINDCYSYPLTSTTVASVSEISIADFAYKANMNIDVIAENWDKIQEKVQEHKEYQDYFGKKVVETKNKRLRQMVKHVQFSGNRCIVFWFDGTTTKSVWNKDESFDPEKAILAAMARRLYEDTGLYNEVLQKYAEDGWDYYNKTQEKE